MYGSFDWFITRVSQYHGLDMQLPYHWTLRLLQVPEEIHNEWRKGGASRQRLQELFATHNFDKA